MEFINGRQATAQRITLEVQPIAQTVRRSIRPESGLMVIAKILERLCWLIAFIALGWFCFALADRILFQEESNSRLDAISNEALASLSASTSSPSASSSQPPAQPSSERPTIIPPAISQGSLLGRIEIPRLRLSAAIVEGDDSFDLRRAVGHIPGTSLPGDGHDGNIGLAAHRDSFFSGLGKLRENDVIVLTDGHGKQRYRVARAVVVGPDDTYVLAPKNGPALTLVTCFPFRYFGSAPDRYVVTARPESQYSE
ncbi:MAG: class D sortase [Candidatus Acidiferrales bacterium]